MKRRDFIKRLFGGAALALASLYVPGRPWSVAVPKPHRLRVPVLLGRPVIYVDPDEPMPSAPQFSYIEFDVGDKDWANYKATGELPQCVLRKFDELRATGRL